METQINQSWKIDETKNSIRIELTHTSEFSMTNMSTEPINWFGFINGERVEFVQSNSLYNQLEDFEFKLFPSHLNFAKPLIRDFIYDYFRGFD